MKSSRQLVCLVLLTLLLRGCQQTASADSAVNEAFEERYTALRQAVAETLDAQEGDQRIALVRNLSPKELVELDGFIPAACPVRVEQLVAVDVRFRRLDGGDGFGRLIVNRYFSQRAVTELGGVREGYVERLRADPEKRNIAAEIAGFFIDNYRSATPYPLDHVIPLHYFEELVREEGTSLDDVSMERNNSYAFGPRQVRDTGMWSRHTVGAWDVNPAYNPIILRTGAEGAASVDLDPPRPEELENGLIEVYPETALAFAFDRTADNPYVIRRGRSIAAYFMDRDWTWGGTWRTLKDYHHFSPGEE